MEPSMNPLALFPTKKDVIRHNFVGLSKSKSLTSAVHEGKGKDREHPQWLHIDRIDPTFGVHGQGAKDEFVQSFRRITSSGLFTKMDKKLAPLKALEPIPAPNKKYVLVEESRLQDLLRFDAVLQREKMLLGQQCSSLFVDQHMPAWIPLPATRHAIHHLCEQQMRRARDDIIRLTAAWNDYCAKNHYNEPPIYMKKSFVENAPLAQRALKLRLVREARQVWNQRRERDTMLFEDDLSRLSQDYTEAMIRQRDYERYFILATRYGPFGEEEYTKDSRPGKRYYIKVVKGALKLQLLWDRYWAMARLRRYRAARNIQKTWRCHVTYKKLHPIIRLRLKFGKRTYYIYCMAQWKRYVHICKLIKEAIVFYRSNYVGICFGAWKRFAAENKAERNERIKKMMLRARNAEVYRSFSRWIQYVQQNKRLKRKLRRWFGLPQFDMWLDYVKWRKHLRSLHASAIRCQTRIRAFLAAKQVANRVKSVSKIHHFVKLVRAVQRVAKMRKKVLAEEFELWLPDEIIRRNHQLNELERGRLQRKQAYVHGKEKAAVMELQRHLSSKHGNMQLEQLLQGTHQWKENVPIAGLSRAEQKRKGFDYLSHQLKKQCVECVRSLEGHNFDAKNPPIIKCFDPRCAATFTNEQQYHAHISQPASSHPTEGWTAHPQATHFHMMLRHAKGQALLREHWTTKYGVAGPVALLDLYVALLDLRKAPAQGGSFYSKALALYDLYCLSDGARRVHLPGFDQQEALDAAMEHLREHNVFSFPGFYHSTRARPGLIRKYVLGWEGVSYTHFTTNLVLRPEVFQPLEFQVFVALLQAAAQDKSYVAPRIEGEGEGEGRQEENQSIGLLHHPTYTSILDEEAAQRRIELKNDYETHRRLVIMAWVRKYTHHAAMIAALAAEVVSIVLDEQVQRLYGWAEAKGVHESVVRQRYREQVDHEASMLFIDEALAWTEENTIEFIFDFYTKALINAMWEVVDYRKGMLQYAGLLKTNLKRKPLIRQESFTSSTRKAEAEWFDAFVTRTISVERIQNPLSKDMAAERIQRRVRLMLAKRKARIAFAKRYKKFFDESYKRYYYYDTHTEESMWDPPLIFKVLFPHAKW